MVSDAMLTGNQIRIARFALRWSVSELSTNSGIPVRTLKRIESADDVPPTNANSLHTLKKCLEAAGIEFIGTPDDAPGIRIHPPKE